jgi:threonine dehydrogenase-like Zn-dependent dehydrogenase
VRAEPAGGTIRATLTHQVAGEAGGRAGDALAVAVGRRGEPLRLWVPGILPCGECPVCRRALCVACPNARVAFPAGGDGSAELPERFLAQLDGEALPATRLMAAGLTAEIIAVAARAGLGPGETAVWMGEAPWAAAGASWSARRGCRTFLLAAPALATPTPSTPALPSPAPSSPSPSPSPSASPMPSSSSSSSLSATSAAAPPEVTRLDPALGPAGWRRVIETAESAGGPSGGLPERRIFVYGATKPLTAAALSLAVPGATLSFLGGAPPSMTGLDVVSPLRIFLGSSFHPDLIPEALAAIRRGEIDVEDLFREVSPSEGQTALADFRSGRDRRLPLLIF